MAVTRRKKRPVKKSPLQQEIDKDKSQQDLEDERLKLILSDDKYDLAEDDLLDLHMQLSEKVKKRISTLMIKSNAIADGAITAHQSVAKRLNMPHLELDIKDIQSAIFNVSRIKIWEYVLTSFMVKEKHRDLLIEQLILKIFHTSQAPVNMKKLVEALKDDK